MTQVPPSSHGGGTFNGGTITHALVVNQAAGEASAFNANAGDFLHVADGAVTIGADLTVISDPFGDSVLRIDAASSKMGFFGHAVASQPAHPVTLADVIAALTSLGLTG